MAKTSKLDNMSFAENALGELDLNEIQESLANLASAAEEAEQARNDAESAFSEAVAAHEERDWETRDSSLEEAGGALERLREQLDILDADGGSISTELAAALEQANNALGEAQSRYEQVA